MINITKNSMIKLEMEIIGYRIIIRHFANTQSVINVTRTDSNIWGFEPVEYLWRKNGQQI